MDTYFNDNERLKGIPFHTRNLTHNEIWGLIEHSDFFIQTPCDSELLLSVKMFGYPGNFISTWVFVGYIFAESQEVRSFRLTNNL
jgi:hypothetical protein